jgi:UDP:flavonoid glycosyltransferase YjiC (YdhE family)
MAHREVKERCKSHIKGHPYLKKAKKMMEKFENDMADKVADRVIHEMKESKKVEKREHKTGKHKTHKR